MPLDILGPANAANSVTARPAETRSFGVNDTWMKDCSSPSVNDGTKLQAGFLNGILAQLRGLIRGNGQTAGAVDIVTLDNADNDIALKSIQHLIQRGLPGYAADTGAANVLVCAPSPALAEYKNGMRFWTKVNNTNTGACTINISGLGAKNIKTIEGADPVAGALRASAFACLAYDGTNFQIISVLGAAAFSQPKASLVLAAIASMPHSTYTNHGLTLGPGVDLTPTIVGGNTFTLPAGTYQITTQQTTRIVVNNTTNIAEHVRLTKNGSQAGVNYESSYLPAGSDLTIYHQLCAVVTVSGSDVLALQSMAGCTNGADYNLGQAFAGSATIVRIGP